jgi:cell division protein FtsI (penicillin-binding protein 3)
MSELVDIRSEIVETPRQHIDGVRKQILETGRPRMLIAAGLFLVGFLAVAGRMVELSLFKGEPPKAYAPTKSAQLKTGRGDIVDRNGVLLATSLPVASLAANPREISNPEEVADKLVKILPELNRGEVVSKLSSDRGFVYLKRKLHPRQLHEVNRLGIPALKFEYGEQRFYPQGSLGGHALGLVDVDSTGIAGIEKNFDAELRGAKEPLRLSIDVRVQEVLKRELLRSIADFRAVGGMGLVMDVQNGELLAMVSLPDYDPNTVSTATPEAMFNRVTLGAYEMGSTFKLFTAAAALDAGTANLNTMFDARAPINISRFQIRDYHPLNRHLSVSEIMVHSSNIGAAKMAVDMGTERQKNFFGKLGMLRPASVELPEVGSPLYPTHWREINTMTIAYGHGLSVSPLQMAAGVAGIINGGIFRNPTVLRQDDGLPTEGVRVISAKTSAQMRYLMRLIVESGTGSKADAEGYLVGGKTGTAEKTGVGGYARKALLSSFVGAFPIDEPRYVVLAMVDEPHGTKESAGYATGGWVAAPVVSRVVSQIGPMLGIRPMPKTGEEVKSLLVKASMAERKSVAQ